MNKQQVWQKVLKSCMPPNCRCIKNKWVFKIKHNGVYWACLAACGYSQVPDINFSKSYSPVVNSIIFCILLIIVIHFGYLAIIVDMETVLLYRELEKEIYMEHPQDMSDTEKDDYIILNKCFYSLVQAS